MRRPLRIALWTLAVVVPLGVAAVAGLWWALGRVPTWYETAVEETDSKQIQRASDEMEQRVADLVSAAHKSGPWEVLVTAEQINAWLVDGLAKKHPDLVPANLTRPRVCIEADGITLGATLDTGLLKSIVSLKVDVYLAELNVIALRLRDVRSGALPWPPGRVIEAVSEAARQADIPLRWRQTDGDPVALLSVPPIDDDKRLRVEAVQLADGEVYIAGTTEEAQ